MKFVYLNFKCRNISNIPSCMYSKSTEICYLFAGESLFLTSTILLFSRLSSSKRRLLQSDRHKSHVVFVTELVVCEFRM